MVSEAYLPVRHLLMIWIKQHGNLRRAVDWIFLKRPLKPGKASKRTSFPYRRYVRSSLNSGLSSSVFDSTH